MPTLVTDPGLLVTESVVPVVEVSGSMDGPWTVVPYLYCERLMLAVNAYDEADLVYELGEVVQPGSFTFASYQPLSILGQYVRITAVNLLDTITWYGFVIGTANERSAVKGPNPAANELTGRKQVVKAVGLEYFLDRVQIDSAYIYNSDDPSNPTRILRSIPFNGGQGVSLDADTRTRENRSEDTLNGEHKFVPSDEEGVLWTLEDIVYYILAHFTTQDTTGAYSPLEFLVSNGVEFTNTLGAVAPSLDPEGMTAFQVFNKLLSPQRGYVWWIEYDEVDGSVVARINSDSLSLSDISVPSGGTIRANRNQESLDFDKERDVDDVIVAEKGSRIYHQIICRGSRMTSTCTLGNISTADINELLQNWTDDIQVEYETAAESDDPKANDAFRKAERFYAVYGAFRLSSEWDGMSGDGGDAERDWTFPVLSDTGSVLSSLEFSVRGLRLLNDTRLKRGWDYRDTSDIEETHPDGTEADYMPTFAILQVAAERELESDEVGYPGTFPAKFQFVEKMSANEFDGAVLDSDSISTGYTLYALKTSPGVLLKSHGMQHAAALQNWSELASTEHEPEVDYSTLRVTTTIEADTYCEGKYPADADLPADVPLQKLVLYVGEEYRLDFLATNTVVDLDNGVPVLTNGGVLRDDRARVQDIARLAYEWYQIDRRPINVQFRNISNLFRLGMLITTIGEGSTIETVNSVVSVIDYNFKDGVMTVKTNDDDLDLARLA